MNAQLKKGRGKRAALTGRESSGHCPPSLPSKVTLVIQGHLIRLVHANPVNTESADDPKRSDSSADPNPTANTLTANTFSCTVPLHG